MTTNVSYDSLNLFTLLILPRALRPRVLQQPEQRSRRIYGLSRSERVTIVHAKLWPSQTRFVVSVSKFWISNGYAGRVLEVATYTWF
jgi:hypothetical protein